MCSLDVLGLKQQGNETFYADVTQQSQRTENGYITRLPRKKDYMPLPSNKEVAAGRLKITARRLARLRKLQDCDQIIQEQKKASCKKT